MRKTSVSSGVATSTKIGPSKSREPSGHGNRAASATVKPQPRSRLNSVAPAPPLSKTCPLKGLPKSESVAAAASSAAVPPERRLQAVRELEQMAKDIIQQCNDALALPPIPSVYVPPTSPVPALTPTQLAALRGHNKVENGSKSATAAHGQSPSQRAHFDPRAESRRSSVASYCRTPVVGTPMMSPLEQRGSRDEGPLGNDTYSGIRGFRSVLNNGATETAQGGVSPPPLAPSPQFQLDDSGTFGVHPVPLLSMGKFSALSVARRLSSSSPLEELTQEPSAAASSECSPQRRVSLVPPPPSLLGGSKLVSNRAHRADVSATGLVLPNGLLLRRRSSSAANGCSLPPVLGALALSGTVPTTPSSEPKPSSRASKLENLLRRFGNAVDGVDSSSGALVRRGSLSNSQSDDPRSDRSLGRNGWESHRFAASKTSSSAAGDVNTIATVYLKFDELSTSPVHPRKVRARILDLHLDLLSPSTPSLLDATITPSSVMSPLEL